MEANPYSGRPVEILRNERPDPELIECWLDRLEKIEFRPMSFGWHFSERSYEKPARIEALGNALHTRLNGTSKLSQFVGKSRVVSDLLHNADNAEVETFIIYACNHPKPDQHLILLFGYYVVDIDQLVIVEGIKPHRYVSRRRR